MFSEKLVRLFQKTIGYFQKNAGTEFLIAFEDKKTVPVFLLSRLAF